MRANGRGHWWRFAGSREPGAVVPCRRGLKKGDRCALLAHNGIDWVALDLAIMAEG